MESKQKIKKQDVQRLRQLIQAVADKNGEDAKLPFSFLPWRGIIMAISLAGLAYGVVATFIVTISTIFFTELTMQQPGKGYQDGLTNSMFLDWLIMFAVVAIVLYCCYKSVYWEWKQLVARGNEEVATWKASPKEASREAVEALEAYLQEHATLGKPSKVKETVEAAATSVGTAMDKLSKEHEAKKRLTSVESSRVRALRRLLKPVLKISGRGEQLPKSTYWVRVYVLITVAIAGIVIGLVSGFFTYLKLFIACLVTLQWNFAFGYLAFIWPFVLIWCLPIAVFVAVLAWHRRETFKEWKELLALADREVEEWSQTTAVPDEVAELQKFLKQAHKYY